MKYSASIFIRTDNETLERFTDEENIYNYFKELFGKKRSRVIEESFSAPDILTKLNAVFKSSGINNLVRITHDDTDFFMDTESVPNDLDEVIHKFKDTLHNAFARFYEEIAVVMESRQSQIDYVIELLLLRVHQVGEYPIQINFSGLAKSTGVVDLENKFKLLVNKMEQNIHKFMDVRDVTISFTKKIAPPDSQVTQEEDFDLEVNTKPNFQTKKCTFFPLYGVSLGETTVKELAKEGSKAKGKDSNNKRYKYYLVNDMNFWHDKHTATHMYLTYTNPIPQKWRNCGLDWDLTYNEWVKLFEQLGFHISHAKLPKKEWYNGKRTLAAQFHASKKTLKNIQLVFDLDFNYSQKTSVNSKGTIYSLGIKAN